MFRVLFDTGLKRGSPISRRVHFAIIGFPRSHVTFFGTEANSLNRHSCTSRGGVRLHPVYYWVRTPTEAGGGKVSPFCAVVCGVLKVAINDLIALASSKKLLAIRI